MDKRLQDVCKLLFLTVAVLFAPVWIPIALVVIATTVLVVGGILTALAMVTFTVLTTLLGVIGLPALLFSTAVTAFAYIVLQIMEKISKKTQGVLKRYNIMAGKKVQEFLDMFSFMKIFFKNEKMEDSNIVKKSDSWGNIPSYGDENEVEAEPSHVEQNFQNRPFPYPRASLGFIGTNNTDDVENFFNSVEELYSVICSLRKLSRMRSSSRMTSRRKTVS